MSTLPRWRRWMRDPWGQLVVYLLIFALLGLCLSGFFRWVRGPARSPYTPFNEGAPPVVAPRR